MTARLIRTLLVLAGLAMACAGLRAAGPDAARGGLDLSPGLLELLRAEMREIAAGVQGVPRSLATGDWNAVRETAERIRASYLMDKRLTPAQAAELQRGLPEGFKELDAQFHRRAERLGAAAAARDGEIAAFHFSRLLESCVRCHSAHAGGRFPGLAPPAEAGHHH